ncbi:SUMF1/EgtB/PvdO family nonheme iron enzyme [Akkermansiaceae bacterium]|nr:SUMF1/EgtB/PvdO family nonheme iron enzyme [Akkermansiaceae bacterium]
MKLPIIPSRRLAVLAGIALGTPAFAVVSIDYVTVGDINNANDAATGGLYGAVGYEYKISKNETTISQYAAFLNAVAKTDTYALYNTSMQTNANISGIQRIGTSGDYSYTVLGSGNRPITYVSWFDAARFTNWLHNGQTTGAQNASTTEDGAYTLNGATSGVGSSKNVGATVWLPSENEWYKAAYYDPNKGGPGVGGYWAQATQSNTINSNTVGAAGAANYFDSTDFAVTQSGSYSSSQNYLTDVGAYGPNSESAYGTNDQAGNVFEWNDAVVFGSTRGMRGGSWANNSDSLPASKSNVNTPPNELDYVGFRVASVPEPSALLLTVLSASALLTRRRRFTL